jgi:hypothetical protein
MESQTGGEGVDSDGLIQGRGTNRAETSIALLYTSRSRMDSSEEPKLLRVTGGASAGVGDRRRNQQNDTRYLVKRKMTDVDVR